MHKSRGKSQIYYPEHILVYGPLEDLLLSCHGFWLFQDRLPWWFLGLGGPCAALSPGLKCGGLESRFGRGPRPHDRRVVGWSLVPRVQAGHVFSGYPARALINESPGNLVRLVYVLAS